MRFQVLPLMAACLLAWASSVAVGESVPSRPFGGRVVAESGHDPDVKLVLPANPDPAEVYAAEEFRDHVEKMTGVRLPIVKGEHGAGRAIVFSSGTSKSDGFDVRLADGTVQVHGESPRGTLYAVYELLERFGGCGWYAPWRTVVPRRDRFVLPDGLNIRERPAFLWRQPSWYQVRKNPLFAARCRLDGETPDGEGPVEDPKFGGHPFRFVRRLYSSHTFYVLVPPEVHFKDHPEWFSLVGGKRLEKNGQLCVSNPQVVDAAVKRALELAAEDPAATVLGVSQMDWSGYCECETCRAIQKEEGSLAGPFLRFVNAIAERIEKVRPEMQIETLTYYDSLVPPRTVRPRRNVMICCCVNGDYTEPFETAKKKSNLEWMKQFETWTKWTDNVILWDYTPNFTWHHVPHPTVDVFGPNLRYYHRHGVKGIYMDGLSVPSGDFGDLKCWILAKLVWNPDQSTDALQDRFFAGCYGAAASKAREVYELERSAYANGRDVRLPFCTEDRPDVFTTADVDRALRLWREAEAAVADDADALFAVRLAKYSSVVLRCQRMLAGVKDVNLTARTDVGVLSADERKVLDEEASIRAEALSRGVVLHHSLARGKDEGLKHAIERLQNRRSALKPVSSSVLGLDYCEMQRGDYSGGEWNERTDRRGVLAPDASAIGGQSFRPWLVGDADALTWRFRRIAFDPDRLYRVRVHLRVDRADGTDCESLRAILWDEGDRQGFRGQCTPSVSSLPDGWNWVEVGTVKLSPTLKLVVKPPRLASGSSLRAVYIDAIDVTLAGASDGR